MYQGVILFFWKNLLCVSHNLCISWTSEKKKKSKSNTLNLSLCARFKKGPTKKWWKAKLLPWVRVREELKLRHRSIKKAGRIAPITIAIELRRTQLNSSLTFFNLMCLSLVGLCKYICIYSHLIQLIEFRNYNINCLENKYIIFMF